MLGPISFRSQTPPPQQRSAPEDYFDPGEISVPVKTVKHIESPEEAMDLRAPRLQRPVLMVHGLAQHADTWINMKNFFTGNAANRYGGVYHVDREAQFLQQAPRTAKVFALDLSDNLASPQAMGAEVRQAITAIMKATGATEVDLVTHSMGSLTAREALRQGENRVRHLVMLAPPNHGAMEATLATMLGESKVYGHYPPDRMGAMDALRLEYGPTGQVRNQYLHDLNQDWKNHAQAVKGSVVTGVGLPTPDMAATGTSSGDGMVAVYQAPLEGADFYVVHPNVLPPDHPHFRDFQDFRYNHLQVVSEPEVFRQVAELLTGPQPPPLPPPAPPATSPTDLQRLLARTAASRQALAKAEVDRGVAGQWRDGGLKVMIAGCGLGTAAAVAATFSPWAGMALGVAGLVAVGAGGAQIWRNARESDAAAAEAAQVAYDALNIVDDMVHDLQRGSSPPPVESGSTSASREGSPPSVSPATSR